MALNPNAAEVHAALGKLALEEFELEAAKASAARALEINPQLLAAQLLKADIHLANFEPRPPRSCLQDALKLNPHSEETLGRLAAAYLAVDGIRTGPETRFGKLAAEVNARNPQPGGSTRRWPTRSTACAAGRPPPTTIRSNDGGCRS